jgi:DNA-binding CsgD family transcriptional regulator/PAS domain-containing protein
LLQHESSQPCSNDLEGETVDDDMDRLVDRFYETVVAPELWSEAVDQLRTSFGVAGAAVGYLDPESSHVSIMVTAGIWDAETSAHYLEDFAAFDPLPARYARVPFGKVIGSQQLVSADEARRNVFFNDLYHPLGLVETLGGRLAHQSDGFGFVDLHRDQASAEFDHTDSARLERLVPHLARVVSLRRAFARFEVKADGLASVVDRLKAGIIVLDPEGQSLHVNAAMRRLVLRKDGLSVDRQGRLRAKDRTVDRILTDMQACVPHGQSGGLVRIPRDGARPYVVLIAPLPAGTGMLGSIGEGRVGVLVLAHDPDKIGRPPAHRLAVMLGLTPGAAELTAALVAGEELKDYAERKGITIHTARFHLKSAFSQLGIRSQTQLIALAIRALADLHI